MHTVCYHTTLDAFSFFGMHIYVLYIQYIQPLVMSKFMNKCVHVQQVLCLSFHLDELALDTYLRTCTLFTVTISLMVMFYGEAHA